MAPKGAASKAPPAKAPAPAKPQPASAPPSKGDTGEKKIPQSDPQPSREALNASITAIRGKIDALQSQLTALNERDKKGGNDSIADEKTAIYASLKTMQTNIKDCQTEQTLWKKRIGEIDRKKRELKSQQGEFQKAPSSVAELDAQIKKLEFQLETSGTSSLKREKKIMADIKALEASKRNVREREDTSGEYQKLDEERKGLIEKVENAQNNIIRIRKGLDGLFAQLREVSSKQNADKEALNSVRQERQTIRDEISKCYDEITALREKFTNDSNEWKKRKDEEREAENIRREKERLAREEKRQKERAEKAARDEEKAKARREFERLRKLNPHEEDIAAIDLLVQFLTNDTAAQHKTAEKQRAAQNFDPSQFAKPGMQQFKRSEAEEDAWLYGQKKKPKPKAAPVATPEQIAPAKPKADRRLPPFPVMKLQAFARIGVNAPTKQSDVAACLDELRKKKAYFESFKRTPEQVDAEEREEAMRAQLAKEARDNKANADEDDAEEANAEEAEGEEGDKGVSYAEVSGQLLQEPDADGEAEDRDHEQDNDGQPAEDADSVPPQPLDAAPDTPIAEPEADGLPEAEAEAEAEGEQDAPAIAEDCVADNA